MASFLERVGAYFIDAIIISFILTMINMGIPSDSELTARMTELETKIMSNEVDREVIMEEYQNLVYDSQKSMVLSSSIGVAVYIVYFVVFQTMYNGQTFGKKLLKLKVVSLDDSSASMSQMFLRYLFIANIFSGVLNVVLLYVMSKHGYMVTYLLLEFFEFIFIITSLLFVLYRKDKRGAHDLMANTKVIKEV